MNEEKELFQLAKQYVMLTSELERKVQMPEYEIEEIKEELESIRNVVLTKRYNIDKFVHYQELYKEMTIEEYFKFIKTL